MDNRKTPQYYLEKIINEIEFIIKHTEMFSLDDFQKDEVLNNCICFKLVQISENAGKLPQILKDNTPNIQWKQISGLRNRVVHDYGNVDMSIIYDTVKKRYSIVI